MATPTHQVGYTRPHLIGIALFLSCLARCKTLCTCYCHRAHRRRDPWRLKLNSRVRLGGLIIQNHESTLCSKKQVTNSETRLLLPPLGNVKWNFHFAAWVAWVFVFFTCSIFFNMLSIFFAGRFWNGSLREAQLDAMLSVPPHESTCSLHTHPGCDLSRSGIPDSPLLSASQKGRFLMGHEPYGNIWNQCGNGCFMLFHMNFNEMWFSLKLMHMIWLRVQDGPNAQREGCARQIGGILTSSQLTFGLL